MKNTIRILIIILSGQILYGQSDSLDQWIEKWIEAQASENGDTDIDYATAFESLDDIRSNPIDLNNTDEKSLSQLFFLTPSQRIDILRHRELYGDFIAIEELQTIPSLDDEVLTILRYFVYLDQRLDHAFKWQNAFSNARHLLFIKFKRTLQTKKGFEKDSAGNASYLGGANHFFLRYKFDSNNNFKIGLTAEKDVGEYFFKGSNPYGFDFYSSYIQFHDLHSKIKTLIIGDYTIGMGQGLMIHNSFGGNKSSYVMNIKKANQSVRPYSSVNESNFFRGIVCGVQLSNQALLNIFASSKKLDGLLSAENENSDGRSFSSINRGGYHRTINEVQNKNNLLQNNYGFSLTYAMSNLKIGIHHLAYHFSNPYNPPNALYNLYAFNGRHLNLISADYALKLGNVQLFGELARSDNGATAQIHSLILPLDRKLDICFSRRIMDADYLALDGNALSVSSQPVNENGYYTGIDLRLDNHWKISTYFDNWKSQWLRYNTDAPSSGKDLLLRFDYQIRKRFNAYIQYRYILKMENSSEHFEKIEPITHTQRQMCRIHMTQKISKSLELRSRAEFSWYTKDAQKENGYLIYEDVIFKPIAKSYSFTFRYALFDISSYYSRIYAYENDLLYEFSIPFYDHRGSRIYFNFRNKVNQHLTWECRYAVTTYTDIAQISKGTLDRINGPIKSEVKCQLKFSF